MNDVSALVAIVDDIVADDFNSEAWVREWIKRPQNALGGKRPADMLDTPEGQEHVKQVLGAVISGAYL